MTNPNRHYTFHLVNGEEIEIDTSPDQVAPDSDYWIFDLSGGREVVIDRRHVVFIQIRDIDG